MQNLMAVNIYGFRLVSAPNPYTTRNSILLCQLSFTVIILSDLSMCHVFMGHDCLQYNKINLCDTFIDLTSSSNINIIII